MKLNEAIDLAREDLGDETAPYLWSDAKIVRYFAQAESEAARRAHLILDSVTPEVCRINLVATKALYQLDKRIIRVERAKLASRTIVLGKKFRRDLDVYLPGWESHTGNVEAYCQDYSTGYFRPYRIPTAADTIMLTVFREPLIAPSLDYPDREFEIPPRYHEGLIHWVEHRCWGEPDTEKNNDALSKLHLDLFEAEFGTRSSAKNEAWEATHHGEDDMEGLS